MCAAEICTRIRACPFGTTGKLNPTTNIPSSFTCFAIATVRSSSPIMIGTIGWMPSLIWNPRAVICERKYEVLSCSIAINSELWSAKSIALIAPAATGGAIVFENR